MNSMRWHIKQPIKNHDKIIYNILEKRGISKEKAKDFLNPALSNLYDPFLLKDVENATNIILSAVSNKEKVLIYGDYDVDGITSTSLLYLFFEEYLNYKVDYYIPDRISEGYGLNSKIIEKLSKEDYDLIITVDCGITAFEEVKNARKQNIKVIITDHHEPSDHLPEANCIINPKCQKESYPFAELAGVGVAFKLCQGIVKKRENKIMTSNLREKLDLIALGTIADIVPLKEENRIMVKEGLDLINNNNRMSLKVMRKKLGLDKKAITSGHIGFIIAPPFNAAGRMAKADMGVELLISDQKNLINKLAKKIISLNSERQREEKKILQEAEKMIEEKIDLEKSYSIILASEKWHQGIVGIVASRIVEKYYRPTIMIAIDEEGLGKGSARSIKDLNLFKAIKSTSDFLVDFGGHAQAAGLSIKKENISEFKADFNKYIKETLEDDNYIPEQNIDMMLSPEDINLELYKKIEKMKPFGINNRRPVFAISDVKIEKAYKVGKDNNHLKLTLTNGNKGIAFNMGEYADEILNKKIDIAFSLNLNNWKNRQNVEMNIKDIKLREKANSQPIVFEGNKFCFYDKRNCHNKLQFIKENFSKIKASKKNIIYLDRTCKNNNYENFFQDNSDFEIIYSNNHINEKKAFDRIFFISLPNSIKEMAEILKKGRDFTKIYLLYGERDYFRKTKKLRKTIPTKKTMRNFYKLLFTNNKNRKIKYKKIKNSVKKNLKLNKTFVSECINIFSELGLVEKNDEMVFLSDRPKGKLDLSKSIRYNKNASIINKFNYFAKLAYDNNLFLLIKELNNFLKEDENESKKLY